ncbi:MAG: DUF3887 domain-containing protein [Taibaiella sp.]|jgi:hypothetical protein
MNETGRFFINSFFNKQFDTSVKYLDTSVRNQITPDLLNQTEVTITSQIGKYIENIETNEEEIDGYEIFYYYSKFEKQQLDIKITFNKNRKIVGFFFVPHKIFAKKQP